MASLLASATNRAPIYGGGLDMSRPEEQLIDAFRVARRHIFAVLPPGTEFDREKSYLVASSLRGSIEMRADAISSKLDNNSDMDDQTKLVMSPEECRQYYIGKYLIAAEGMGAYASMAGRRAVDTGELNEQDYYDGIEAKLISFSDIIEAGEKGQLKSMLNAEQVATPNESGNIVIATSGTAVEASRRSASGLGVPPGVLIALTIVAIAIVAGICYVVLRWHQIDASMNAMLEICRRAVEKGDDKSIKMCNDFTKEATSQPGVSDLLGKDLTKYLVIGGAIYLGIVLLPSITQSFMATQDVMAQRRMRAAAAAANRRNR